MEVLLCLLREYCYLVQVSQTILNVKAIVAEWEREALLMDGIVCTSAFSGATPFVRSVHLKLQSCNSRPRLVVLYCPLPRTYASPSLLPALLASLAECWLQLLGGQAVVLPRYESLPLQVAGKRPDGTR